MCTLTDGSKGLREYRLDSGDAECAPYFACSTDIDGNWGAWTSTCDLGDKNQKLICFQTKRPRSPFRNKNKLNN